MSDVIGSSSSSTADRKTPALGIAWSNLVTVRLMLHRTNEHITVTRDDPSDSARPEETQTATGQRTYEATIRLLESVFAPHLPNAVCRYVISEDGVQGYGWTSLSVVQLRDYFHIFLDSLLGLRLVSPRNLSCTTIVISCEHQLMSWVFLQWRYRSSWLDWTTEQKLDCTMIFGVLWFGQT